MLPAKRTAPAQNAALEAVLLRLIGPQPDRADTPEDWITAVRRQPAVDGEFAAFPDAVDARLRRVLAARGIERLYSHQAEAVAYTLAGRHVVVTTPTASGKTLCYNVPVLNAILRDPSSRALFLFPTKALAQDQLAELHELSSRLSQPDELEVGVFTYDGDTPQDARRAIRGRAHVVLSNPDMIHSGILPHHPRWAKLFENLRYVVIDELHAYRGVFGSHLTNVLRRLRRVCRHYGSNPIFICSSATIANPRELAERLVEEPFELVSKSGAPRGEKVFLFVNPPVVNRELGIRRSYLSETRRIAGEFLKRKLQLIVFAQSRLATEILTTYLKDDFRSGAGAEDEIRGYRGGYLPQRRREIERGLRAGSVRAVVSTNALELGVDIGALDVAVLAGYPGTVAATWQRAGRAGRRKGPSAAVLVASSAPLDQYVVRNPSYFFDASPEHALVNPDNLQILVDHVKCAAFELPFTLTEQFGRHDVQEVLTILQESGFVHRADDGAGGGQWQWTNESYPADAVSLRSISSDNFVIVDTTRGADVIGETSFTSGPSTLHEKAIYLLEGELYQVEQLDFEGRKAYVRRIDCDYYTDAITYTKVTVLETFEQGSAPPAGPARHEAIDTASAAAGLERRQLSEEVPVLPSGFGESVPAGTARSADYADRAERLLANGLDARSLGDETRGHGEVHVSSRVVGFKKIKFYTNENVGSGELDLPEQQMHTTAYWLTIPPEVMGALPHAPDDRRDGVVGLSFAMRQVAQLLLMCDRQDIGVALGSGDEGDDTAVTRTGLPASVSNRPRLFIYDNYPGGIGFSQPLFAMHADLMSRTRTMIAGCECERGCPSCVGPVGDIGPLAKLVALRILDLLARPARPAPPGQALVDGGPAPGWGEHPVALDGGVF
jgi:DEAD/DEAH box helicase domain-containing protein